MSDFFSGFWGIAIALTTVTGMIACMVLLIVSGRTRPTASDDGSTGHVWDGDLKEMNNPLPLWWVGLFVITILFSAGYLVLYPGLGERQGSLAWSSEQQHEAQRREIDARAQPLFERFKAKPIDLLAKDPQAVAMGQRIFLNQCAQCHGSDGRGSRGFPNLADADWLYGGSAEKIVESITHGRQGVMPALGAAVGGAAELSQLAHYVLSLSESAHDPVKAALGKPRFAACAGCHGSQGEGNQAVGAPNLKDKVWLHGWGESAIVSIVTSGRSNMMPAQSSKLSEDQIRVVAAYVMSLNR
jgi:cytochrome c oxidase cbb3-type subunit 3